MCDPTVSCNLGLRDTPSLEKTQNWITSALQDPLVRAFAIKHNGHHVGNINLDRIDKYLSTARLSVYIGETSARHLGVGCTGIYLALREAFFSLDLYKVWLIVHTRNYSAINVYHKLGFVLEGILRDEFWLDGQRIDVLYLGLKKIEFEHLVVQYSEESK